MFKSRNSESRARSAVVQCSIKSREHFSEWVKSCRNVMRLTGLSSVIPILFPKREMGVKHNVGCVGECSLQVNGQSPTHPTLKKEMGVKHNAQVFRPGPLRVSSPSPTPRHIGLPSTP